MSDAAHGDHETLPTLRAWIADAAHARAIARTLHHAGREPAVDVWGEVTDDVTTHRVHPHARLLHAGRIRHEDQPVTLAESMHDAGALSEDGPVDRGLEARRIGEDRRHGTPPGRSVERRASHNSMDRSAPLSGRRCTRRSSALIGP